LVDRPWNMYGNAYLKRETDDIHLDKLLKSEVDIDGIIIAFAAVKRLKKMFKQAGLEKEPKVAIICYYARTRRVGDVYYDMLVKQKTNYSFLPDALLTTEMITGLTFDASVVVFPRTGQYYNRRVLSPERLLRSVSRDKFTTVFISPMLSGWAELEKQEDWQKGKARDPTKGGDESGNKKEQPLINMMKNSLRQILLECKKKLLWIDMNGTDNKQVQLAADAWRVLESMRGVVDMCVRVQSRCSWLPGDRFFLMNVLDNWVKLETTNVPTTSRYKSKRKGWCFWETDVFFTWLPAELRMGWLPGRTSSQESSCQGWTPPWAMVMGKKYVHRHANKAYIYFAFDAGNKITRLMQSEMATLVFVWHVGKEIYKRKNCADGRFKIYLSPQKAKSARPQLDGDRRQLEGMEILLNWRVANQEYVLNAYMSTNWKGKQAATECVYTRVVVELIAKTQCDEKVKSELNWVWKKIQTAAEKMRKTRTIAGVCSSKLMQESSKGDDTQRDDSRIVGEERTKPGLQGDHDHDSESDHTVINCISRTDSCVSDLYHNSTPDRDLDDSTSRTGSRVSDPDHNSESDHAVISSVSDHNSGDPEEFRFPYGLLSCK